MQRDRSHALERSRARLRAVAARGKPPPANVLTLTVSVPARADFSHGRTHAVPVTFPRTWPFAQGTVVLEADGGRIVPMLFDQPRLFCAYRHYPHWYRYIESVKRVGTALALYDAQDVHVATIEVA